MLDQLRQLMTTNRVFTTYWSWLALLLVVTAVVAFVRGDMAVGVVALIIAAYSVCVVIAAARFGRGTFRNVLRLVRRQ